MIGQQKKLYPVWLLAGASAAGALAGATLLAINFNSLQNRTAAVRVVLFALGMDLLEQLLRINYQGNPPLWMSLAIFLVNATIIALYSFWFQKESFQPSAQNCNWLTIITGISIATFVSVLFQLAVLALTILLVKYLH